jgi:signal transduction histidine kinase
MKTKPSYRSALVVKVVLLLMLGFLLINTIMWLYMRNEMRDIGYYLRFGRRDEIALLISEYLGDPPSRFKARMLAQAYNITVLYRENGRILWAVEKRRPLRPSRNNIQNLEHMRNMRRMMENMHGSPGGRSIEHNVLIASNRTISIIFPPPFARGRPITPLYFILSIGLLIGLILFLALRRTFSPLDRIIEASGSIGEGDLSHRIEYGRGGDFDKVASAFNTMTTKLSAMLSNQRELLHFVSHELRTPLARIRLALELKDKNRSYKIIRDEVDEIDSLIGEVSELSRLDNIDREMNREWIDLVSLIQELSSTYRELVVLENTSSSVPVLCNPVLIRKAFSNLLDNAVKYSDGEIPVRVTIAKQQEGWEISVKNSGLGIPKNEIDRIWEPFYRATNAGIYRVEGRGLGLVVVRKAVELSGGRTHVQSSEQGPTIFTVWLPADEQEGVQA